MKRKLFLCIIALTTLMMSGCAQKNAQGAELNSTSDTATHQTTTEAGNNTTGQSTTGQTTTGQSATQQTTDHSAAGQTTTNHQAGTTQNTAGTTEKISEEDAKSIALTHAGFTADQVTFIKSGIDRDDGRENYDVEFYTNDHKEYDYEIDPYTGEVLDYDYDAEYYVQSADTPTGEEISADKAKQIALDQVPGATTKDIREFKSDYDNGRLQYEGKIYYDKKEYEFEIDGYTGSILEWDVEPIYNGNL